MDAVKKLGDHHQNFHLIVVGEGPYLEEMKNALTNEPVVFTGYLTGECLSHVYASSDIFVFPSSVDTFGNVVLEAQASGIPVVVTDQGGAKENIILDKTGMIVPSDNSSAMAQTLSYLLDDPDQLNMMKYHAREYAKTRSFDASFSHFWKNYGRN